MLRVLGIFAGVVAVAIAAVLIYATTRPDSFRVQRTATIQAPPERIYPLIEDFRNWRSWSPYEKLDPGMKRSVAGADRGKGATYAWNGNNNVGEGRMEITDAAHPRKVTIKLDFIRPFEGHNTAEFTLDPRGDTTDVTWAMYGPATYLTKLMSVFVNFDTMIGRDFETGLASMKTVAEKP